MITHKRRGILSEKNIPRCPFLFKISALDVDASWADWLLTANGSGRKANPKTERRLHYHISTKLSAQGPVKMWKDLCSLLPDHLSWFVPVGTLTGRTALRFHLGISR